ncbi:Ig-like domain-containing protein [Streptomyces sp900116325]|uniref:Ig-like domain-containing protein n=1 Tax=Streptomyces sp. 900116325 TaxID=3154295 RepID=UPI0033A299CC
MGRYVLGLLLSMAMAALAGVALPAGQAAAVPPGTYAYVANANGDNVSVIDTATDAVIATIPLGDGPRGVAVTPDGTRVYVTNNNSDNVSVIDTTTAAVIATVPVGDDPQKVVVTPDATHVYVPNNDSDNVSVIDTVTDTVTATVPVGDQPFGVAVTPDGTRVYVTNEMGDNVSVIDTATDTVTATVPVGTNPGGVAVTPDGTRVYVLNFNGGNVSVIDTATDAVMATVPVGSQPYGVAVTPDGTRAYVTNQNSGTVSVIDTATGMVTATVPVGTNPYGVAVTPDGTRAYVTNYSSGNVSVIDTATNTVTTTIPAGNGAIEVAIAAIDTTPPAAPVIATPGDGRILGDGTPAFAGTGEAGSKVTVTDAGSTVCTATVDAAGKWSCTPTTVLAEGEHTITATATDEAGNTSQSRSITVTIDTKPPAAPVVTTPADGSTLGDSTPAFAGTGEAGSKVTVTDAGSTVCTAMVDAAGKWSCTPGTALVEGEHTITATATDEAGNTGQGGPITVTIAPPAPVITAPADGSTLGRCSKHGHDAGEWAGRGGCLLTFTGTGGARDTVTVTEGKKQICSATVNNAGNWSCTGRTRHTSGKHTFIATATGSTGAIATSEPVTVTIKLRHRPQEWLHRSLATTAPGVRERGVTNKRLSSRLPCACATSRSAVARALYESNDGIL